MATQPFPALKEKFLHEIQFVNKIGAKIFIYPFIGRSKNAVRGFIATCAFLLCTITQLSISLIMTKFKNWFEIINIAPNLGVCVLILVKYAKMHTSQKVYHNVVQHFRTNVFDFIETKSDTLKVIFEEYINSTKFILRLQYYYTITLVAIVILFPRFLMFYETDILGHDIQYLYPFDGWYPFDEVKWYYAVYAWESLMTTIVIVLFVFANMVHILITKFICMELKILGSVMENLISSEDVKNITKGKCAMETHGHIKMRLKAIIKRHQFIVRIVADLEKVLGAGMLMIYVFGSIFICLTIFTATVVDNLYMCLRYFSFFCSLLIEVLIQCIIGQMLIDHSAGFEQSIYFVDWTYADRDTKRMLLILLIRAQKPLKFSAKGYLTMNLDTFSGVCSLSYQFFNLLRTAYS